MAKALPAYMYGDPSDIAERLENKSCHGCESLIRKMSGFTGCTKGKRGINRCSLYKEKKGVDYVF